MDSALRACPGALSCSSAHLEPAQPSPHPGTVPFHFGLFIGSRSLSPLGLGLGAAGRGLCRRGPASGCLCGGRGSPPALGCLRPRRMEPGAGEVRREHSCSPNTEGSWQCPNGGAQRSHIDEGDTKWPRRWRLLERVGGTERRALRGLSTRPRWGCFCLSHSCVTTASRWPSLGLRHMEPAWVGCLLSLPPALCWCLVSKGCFWGQRRPSSFCVSHPPPGGGSTLEAQEGRGRGLGARREGPSASSGAGRGSRGSLGRRAGRAGISRFLGAICFQTKPFVRMKVPKGAHRGSWAPWWLFPGRP